MLLTVFGDSAVRVLRGLIMPAQLEDQTFDQLLSTLRDHYGNPQTQTEPTARFEFGRTRQTEGQPLECFVAELRRIAEDCHFGNFFETALRDQLIQGVPSVELGRQC